MQPDKCLTQVEQTVTALLSVENKQKKPPLMHFFFPVIPDEPNRDPTTEIRTERDFCVTLQPY